MFRVSPWAALVVMLVGCGIDRGTAPGGESAQRPRRFIVANPDTTTRTYVPEPCGLPMGGTDNHCPFVVPIAPEEMGWMWDAVDQTTCPDVQRVLNSQMMHGRIQKVNLQASMNTPFVFGFSHRYSDPMHLDWSRMHLDARNAYTGLGAVGVTMRHEVMHYLHPELDGQEAQIEALANSCGPH